MCTAGQRVSHEGHTWKAKWWTTAPPPHDPRNSAPYAPDHEHCTPRP
ncbi:carbohydrate-binding protein [Streptomyces sp. NRRL B-1347]